MSAPVLFVIGAGPKIGQFVADAFAEKGYKVAVAARSRENGIDEKGYFSLKLDLADPKNVDGAFAKVTKELGIPSVVVYNGEKHCYNISHCCTY